MNTVTFIEHARDEVKAEVERESLIQSKDDYLHRQLSGDNIWYDKCYSLVLYPNGWGGMNVEHSGIDAMVKLFTSLH